MSIEDKATALLQEHGVDQAKLEAFFAGADWTLLVVDEAGELSARVVPGICNYGALPPGVTVHYFHDKPAKAEPVKANPLDHDGNGKSGGSLPRAKRK